MRIPRLLATAAVIATAAGGLSLAPSAVAAPVFVDANTVLQPFNGTDTFDSGDNGVDDDCTVTSETNGTTTTTPVGENGAPVSVSTSVSATFGNDTTAGDTAQGAASITATGSVASSAGLPTSLDFATSGTATLNDAQGSSDCGRTVYAEEDLAFNFTVQQAGILTLDMDNSGPSYGEVYIYRDYDSNSRPYFDNVGKGLKFDSTSSVYLPVGAYRGYFAGFASTFSAQNSTTLTGTTSVHGSFHVAGSVVDRAQGKAAKYVNVGSRSCTANTLSPQITKKARKAKRINKVEIFLNDKKVKTVKRVKKGKTYTLAVPADEREAMRIEVTLKRNNKGRIKTQAVNVEYEACQ